MTARRPIPPVSFRTADLQTLEDLRKLRASQADILTYLDALIAGTGAGTITTVAAGTGIGVTGGTGPVATVSNTGVLSFNSRTGAVVPGSSDYTATQVGLGNVTNDAQLKRSANDFTTFTHKTSPALADVLILEDSAASGVKKYATISEAVGVAAASQSPYTVRTSTPSAYDDEFLGGSNDLATRGWTVRNVTDAVTMTRLGDVDPWAASLTNAQYNLTLQGTYALVQFPRNKRCIVYRAFTPSTAGHLFIRAELTAGIGLGNEYCAARVWLNNAGVPDTGAGTTLSAFAMIQNAANVQTERWGRGDTTDINLDSADNLTSRDGRGVFYSATNQYRFFATGVGGIHQHVPKTAAVTGPTIANLAWIGFDFLTADVVNTTNLSSMFIVDYIRHFAGTGWVL